MFYSELINKAIDLAYDAHQGQKDKAGRPYFLHPVMVAQKMDNEAEICAALLHDVVEDTGVTIDELREIFPPEVTDAVDVLTHRDGVKYEDYVRGIKANPIARKVKLADIAHNMDETRISCDDESRAKYEERRKKYELARAILTET